MNTYQPYTYLIGWTKLNQYYYGSRYAQNCHPNDLWVSYFTSSITVKKYRQLYGEPHIIKVDQKFNTAKEALDYEKQTLIENNAANSEQWLNQNNGIGTWATPTEERNRKISNAKKGKPGPKHSDETKRKMSKTRTGRKRTKDECKAISEGKKGRSTGPQSEETKLKRSNALKGRKRTEAEKQAIRDGQRRRRQRERLAQNT